jgi:hypothetical protein
VNPAQAREEARHILAERRFHGTSVPRPLHGFFSWLTRHLHFVARGFDWLSLKVGGQLWLWTIIAVVVLVIAAFVTRQLARRRVEVEARGSRGRRERGEDPAELERLAGEAERRGDLEVALRLRFRAGLLRLGRARVLPLRPSLRTREARRTLRSSRFDRLARDFDEVVYGRRSPSAADVETARTEWPRVVAEARP